jgi:NitT/TauT family transport system substrate-binding protein
MDAVTTQEHAARQKGEENVDRRRMLQGAACAVGAWTAPCLAAPERPKINVAVGGRTLIVYLPFVLAWSRGAFRRQGLDVEISDFTGGTKALEALVGGSADFVSGAYEHVILLGLKGIRLKAVALQDESFGLVVAVQKSKAHLYKSAADLKGRIIGVTSPGSASSNGLKLFLAKAGLRESDVSAVGVGAGAAAVAAMTSGRLDAISNFDPVISLLERADAIHPLIDTRNEPDLKTLYGGPIAASSIYTTEVFLRRNPMTAQAVANAMAETLAWLRKAAIDDIVESVPPAFYGNDRAFYAQVVEKNRTRFSADGVITPAAAEATWRTLAGGDPRQQGTKLDLKDTFDMSFMEAAAKSL